VGEEGRTREWRCSSTRTRWRRICPGGQQVTYKRCSSTIHQHHTPTPYTNIHTAPQPAPHLVAQLLNWTALTAASAHPRQITRDNFRAKCCGSQQRARTSASALHCFVSSLKNSDDTNALLRLSLSIALTCKCVRMRQMARSRRARIEARACNSFEEEHGIAVTRGGEGAGDEGECHDSPCWF
jgi:hypothetical protein